MKIEKKNYMKPAAKAFKLQSSAMLAESYVSTQSVDEEYEVVETTTTNGWFGR